MQNPISLLPGISVSRTGRILATAVASAMVLTVLVRPTEDAVANGDTRSLSMRHLHTGETIDITYKRDGRYDADALKKINWFLRDWRREAQTRMDPRMLDTVWLAYRTVGATQPINVVCGYRSPETNGMLRRRSRGVAKASQHMLGKAMDFFIPGVSLSKLRVAGLRLQRGGVGFYPTSGSPFVHMDAGGVRMWPRMSRGELASVFPDGKTVLLPADGRQMPGYQVAMAEILRNGGKVGAVQGGGEDDSGGSDDNGDSGGGFFAALFGRRNDNTPPPVVPDAPQARTPAPVVVAMNDAPPQRFIPLPSRRPSDIDAVQAQAPAAPNTIPAATDTGPKMIWQSGPNGGQAEGAPAQMAANVPLPPVRPGVDAEAPAAQMASLDTVASDAGATPLPVARPDLLQPKPAIFADLSEGSEGFMKRGAAKQPQKALGFADVSPVTQTARPPRPALIATRFEKMNFASISAPVQISRNKAQATLTKPDLRATASLIASPSKALMVKFGEVAYQDLRTGKFSGPAVKPMRTASFEPMPDIFTGSIAAN